MNVSFLQLLLSSIKPADDFKDELGPWNLSRHKIYRAYIREYQKHFPTSAPEEDGEDRLILYRLRFNLTSSGCYLNNIRFRELYVVLTRAAPHIDADKLPVELSRICAI